MEERWFDEELSGCRLGHGRLERRLRQLLERMEVGFGESIPLACQDWTSTKAAYRFFSNDQTPCCVPWPWAERKCGSDTGSNI